jgi:hypothetical protein
MASLILLLNPLAPHTREIHPLETDSAVIDWLQERYPDGFGMPTRFYVNGDEKPLDDLDYRVRADDVVTIVVMPGVPAALLTSLAINFAISLALAGAALAFNYLFQPKTKTGGGKDSPVKTYDITADQNAARLGGAIPVVYGSVLTTPDYVAQPYTFYDWEYNDAFDEKYAGIQYLDMLLCVGQGNIDVTNVYVADSLSTQPPAGVVTWQAFKPSQHNSTMGVIAAAMGGGFHENVISSPEVGNQEFLVKFHTAGPFATCKPGNKGSKFQIDVVFPQGQTDPGNSGDVNGRTTLFYVDYFEIDDNDNPVGPTYTNLVRATTKAAITNVNLPDNSLGTSQTVSEQNKTLIGSPLRKSFMFVAPKSARWAVKITRDSFPPNAKNGADRFVWSGLKLFADYPSTPVYGNVTLLAVRIKASLGVSGDGSARIRARAVRRLSPPGGGAEVQSTSGADAFADVYTNAVYGAARPQSELDIAALSALRTEWAGYDFNYVFADRITVWEALRTIATPFGAEPVPNGQVMSIAQDGVKPVRSMLFTDANIVEGSLAVSYSFDDDSAPDGVEIEYINPLDFRQSYTRYPTTSLQPDQFTVEGVTNTTHAAQYAQLTWQRRQGQRKSVKFDTELEGLLLLIGDRIGISHNVMKWGDGGLILGQSGLALTADHDLDWSGGAKQIILRRPDGSATDPVTVTQGAQPNIIVLPSTAPTTINFDGDYEFTSFAFGASSTLVRDFIVTSVKPNGENTVTIEAVNYAPGIFTGAMPYMSA